MPIEWNTLRPWNNSQQNAFEELCCQLACCEKVAGGFTRFGAPDGGIECAWTLKDNTEYGWQAKFFDRLEKSQIRQIEESIETSLRTHPKLARFTLCLPFNLSDPRIPNFSSAMSRWKSVVAKWEKKAKKTRSKFEIRLWGETEIFERLSKTEHRGRYYFWFNKQYLDKDWLKQKLDTQCAAVGARYTPELNVRVPIAALFEGLCRTKIYYESLLFMAGKLRHAMSDFANDRMINGSYGATNLRAIVESLLSLINSVDFDGIASINFHEIAQMAAEVKSKSWDCDKALEDAAVTIKNDFKPSLDKPYLSPESFQYERSKLRDIIDLARNIEDFSLNDASALANTPALLVVGKAGTGKTHLFFDIASSRVAAGLPTLLFLGKQFFAVDPWAQITQKLELDIDSSTLLAALAAAAEATNSRALIMIDGINEGEGINVWPSHILSFLATVRKFPRIVVALSIRSSYERIVFDEDISSGTVIRVEHHGFSSVQYDAVKSFFKYYQIIQSTAPLMHAEFQNPLFLSILCKTLVRQNQVTMPADLDGLTDLFEAFIESVDKALSRRLKTDLETRHVRRAISKLATAMTIGPTTWLTRERAKELIPETFGSNEVSDSLFHLLIEEGILLEDYIWDEGGKHAVVGFTYERFSDHLIAKILLELHFDNTNPIDCFSVSQPIGRLFQSESKSWNSNGLIEALAIQVPERAGRELPSLVSRAANWITVKRAVIESLLWRRPQTINPDTEAYLDQYIRPFEETQELLLDVVLSVTAQQQHPYNANYLHKRLLALSMTDRDAIWSMHLHQQYGAGSAVDRLIECAWSMENAARLSDESAELLGVTLSWFLTSSNRFLRDCTTKALVTLLTPRLPILRSILKTFKSVDDVYVTERLYAVAYGCVMRSSDNKTLNLIAHDVFENCFQSNKPIPHILARDYARGLIECADARGESLNFNIASSRPPYKSTFPTFPTESEIDCLVKELEKKESDGSRYATSNLHTSCTENMGDFFNYCVSPDVRRWSNRKIDVVRPKTRKEVYEIFTKSLNKQQRAYWKKYKDNAFGSFEVKSFIKYIKTGQEFKVIEPDEKAVCMIETALRKLLNINQLKMLDEAVLPYMREHMHEESDEFPNDEVGRWIFKRVVDLGWCPTLFGAFDRNIDRAGRQARKAERMGKKYQWIALHEILAYISDNYAFKHGIFNDDMETVYNGPWQLSIRDIDPSFILARTEREEWDAPGDIWWFPATYEKWSTEKSNLEWIKARNDIPNPLKFLSTITCDGKQWLMLDGSKHFEQPIPLGADRNAVERRELWIRVKTYFVRNAHASLMLKWLNSHDLLGHWMPDSGSLNEVFLGEAFWSPAYKHTDNPYFGQAGWTKGYSSKFEPRIPRPLLLTTEEYQHGSGNDCSIDDTPHVDLPCKYIVTQMNLRWDGTTGNFVDRHGNVIARDPSVSERGPGAIVVRQEDLMSLCRAEKLGLIWTITGEKRILGPISGNREFEGRLTFSGAYVLKNGQFIGGLNFKFESPGDFRKPNKKKKQAYKRRGR